LEGISGVANRPNHLFVVGETYKDIRGTYRVISVEENFVVYDYGDGIQHKGDAATKWRINHNLVSEQNLRGASRDSQPMQSPNPGEFWVYEETSPIFAEIIRAYGKKHRDFMTHEKIVTAFIAHPDGELILKRPHDDRPNSYWVGVMKAHFSRKYNGGMSEWDNCFEPKRIGGVFAYRVRKKTTNRAR
jgi:hypothetical protein